MNDKYHIPENPLSWIAEKNYPYDLEDRLITFAVNIIRLSDKLPPTRAGNHIGGQIVRSGTAPALHYGEAQGAESRRDFVHKMKIALKELRETLIALKIIKQAALITAENDMDSLSTENNELIAIFVKSLQTAAKNE